MLITFKNNLHWASFSFGLIFYCILLANQMLSWSIVWLLFIIYGWLIIALIFQRYVFKHFLYLLCFSGIWVSFTWFFLRGIEEVPLPRGAFLFKAEGVVPSIILFMLFTIPLIIYHFGSNLQIKETETPPPSPRPTPPSPPKNNKDWEEASIEDIESGDFEVV